MMNLPNDLAEYAGNISNRKVAYLTEALRLRNAVCDNHLSQSIVFNQIQKPFISGLHTQIMRDAQINFPDAFLCDQFLDQRMHCSTTADHIIQYNRNLFSAEIANHFLDCCFFGPRAEFRGNSSVKIELSADSCHELCRTRIWSNNDHIFAVFEVAKYIDKQLQSLQFDNWHRVVKALDLRAMRMPCDQAVNPR